MADGNQSLGNILVNPEGFATKLSNMDSQHDAEAIRSLEEHLAHRLRLGGAITYIDNTGQHVLENRDGVRPFPEGSIFPADPEIAELEIRELAFQHNVQLDKTDLDEWCEAVSANAGDDIQSDDVEQLIIGLRRLDAIDGVALTKLHARYLEEVIAL